MSILHNLGVQSSEKVGPSFILEGLLMARKKTIHVVTTLKEQIAEGMTELEARKLAMKLFQEQGVKKHWHIPYIRFGSGTVLTFRDPLQKEYNLKKNDPFYIDVGPVWLDETTGVEYEGDYGDSFVFGENPQAQLCVTAARDVFQEAQTYFQASHPKGNELYEFIKTRVQEKGYVFTEAVQGHRISDFPHSKYARGDLGHYQFTPSPHLWVLEVHLQTPDGEVGAFFEDLL